jgi:NRPS condensation-like uncharacterized protein
VDGSLLTVPLNRLDELFLGLDSEDEPWNVHFEVRVNERLDPDRLVGAVRTAAMRHPIARARLADWRYTDRGYRWEIDPKLRVAPLEVSESDDEETLAVARGRLVSRSPSLDSSPPFALLLAHGSEGDTVVLNAHHAAVDGVGAARLMRSIVRAYYGAEDPVPPLDPVAVRDVRALAGAASLSDGVVRMRAVGRAALTQWGPPSRMAPDGEAGGAGYGIELLTLSQEETAAVRALRSRDTTFNDVLLAALAVAVRRWNTDHDWTAGRVTMSMPVNLRPREWRTEVVGNFASYLTVSGGIGDNVASVLPDIGRQTRAIKRDGLAGLVIDMLEGPSHMTIAAKRRLPELIPMTGDVVVDTASLSNLGMLESFGDTVEGVWFSPPGRMPLGAALGAITHGGRLRVALRYRRAQFDAPAAGAFTQLFRDVLLAG